MTDQTPDAFLVELTADLAERPIPAVLKAARVHTLEAVATLGRIDDAVLIRPWMFHGAQEDVRYGFYNVLETFEAAAVGADLAMRAAGIDRGRSADRIAPATAARWDFQGLLETIPAATWDADPGGGEWTIRLTIGHVIGGQRGYGVGSGWWHSQAIPAGDPDPPGTPPDAFWRSLPSDEAESRGTPADVRARLDAILDRDTERLASLPADHLTDFARWGDTPVDMGFRFGRWSSHIQEHTVQVEKTLAMLDHRPTEVDRLVRLILAAWGRAEAVVFGAVDAEAPIAVLRTAADDARSVAGDVLETATRALPL